ncbi:hypothetical protein E5554_15950 [Sphingobium sp. PAMC28499]|uniref:hypothetical protein n=1 Tax=Sphingobium sp. PAMC28499 TaxID=2565554 RepID=UPI00109DE1D3|nr:hypothetical protein [Sphingobium sp. PAMC28499]QCB39186.1 hypothetical protein E5554_15950 [Sphingobium sp. PAMC28499]
MSKAAFTTSIAALAVWASPTWAAEIICSPLSQTSIFQARGEAQSSTTKPDKGDGFKVVQDADGRYDIIWNTPQFDFKTVRAGGIDLRALDKSVFPTEFGLSGGGFNFSYTLHVNKDEDGSLGYSLTTNMFVGNYVSLTEFGKCRM